MKLTCAQMDVLISFYIEGDLSSALKLQVEEHLKNCSACRAKFDIIKTMLSELKNAFDIEEDSDSSNRNYHTQVSSKHYKLFKDNLSAYIDNELPSDENIKIKKFTINNASARQDLENTYNLRRLMNNSFRKTKSEARQDFSRNVLKKLELEDEASLGIHPAIKLLIGFTFIVLVVTSVVLMSFSV